MTTEWHDLTRSLRERFRDLHGPDKGLLLLPNCWDIGSARVLELAGAGAVATSSSGHAGSLGVRDGRIGSDELYTLVEQLVGVLRVPLSIDAEEGFGDDAAGVASTVDMLATIGAAGVSIEDRSRWEGIYPIDEAVERVGAAAEVANAAGMVLTARADAHLYPNDDPGQLFEDTLERLRRYAAAGAGVVYAPGLTDPAQIRRVVAEVDAPVNVLLLPGGPTVPELRDAGVRRASTGGALAWFAYAAMLQAMRQLGEGGDPALLASGLPPDFRAAAFAHRRPPMSPEAEQGLDDAVRQLQSLMRNGPT